MTTNTKGLFTPKINLPKAGDTVESSNVRFRGTNESDGVLVLTRDGGGVVLQTRVVGGEWSDSSVEVLPKGTITVTAYMQLNGDRSDLSDPVTFTVV